VEISLSPYSTNKGKFVIAFIVDNTSRKQAEEKLRNYSIELEKQVTSRTAGLQNAITELEKTKQELHNALDKERDVNELKSRFVSLASHEFRTPLTTILTSLYLITTLGDLNESQQRHAAKIKKSINNLTDILNDFLSLSKLEEGKIEHMPVYVDLQHTIAEIVGEMTEFGNGSQRLDYRHSGRGEVQLDTKLLRNILFNLISNAIKFSPVGAPVLISSLILDAEIRISVRDSGIGISKEDQKRLFERFFRGENATYIQGTGLGLNLVAKYAELMSGTITVESSAETGSCFTLILPRISALS
jgi:signal transduction histidine kinase